jgi:hypothetical protein
MADENKPAFYPRVGNIKAKNFKSAQPKPFIDDERAMELPRLGEDSKKFDVVDLSIPTKENLELGRRMTERDVQLKRQRDADMSPLEKLAGGIQAGRLFGSALAQSVASIPTALREGSKAADEYVAKNIYQPTQPKALEYAQDVGDFLERLETEYKLPPVATGDMLGFTPLIQAGSAQAARQVPKAAMRGAQALESRMAPAVTQALDRGGLQRDLLLGLGQGTQSNIMKPSGGGNWIEDSVKQALSPLKRNTAAGNDSAEMLRQMRERYTPEALADMQLGSRQFTINAIEQLEKDVALNNWVDSNLANYVKKQMGTEKDPVRRLAEEGISHLPDTTQMSRYIGDVEANRQKTGFPQGLGQSEQAKVWESLADSAIRPKQLGETIRANNPNGMTMRELMLGEPGGQWAAKAPDTEMIYEMRLPNTSSASQIAPELGFDHIMDVLREDVVSGRIRPEQLNKVSMEQAVRRAHEYDLEMEARRSSALAEARKDLPIYKDYPEGYKWVQLKNPGDFAAESEAMGHSARGYEPPKGHPDWVEGSGDRGMQRYGLGGWEAIKRGDAKVYSLVDKKGEPHVTIEVGSDYDAPTWYQKNKKLFESDTRIPSKNGQWDNVKLLHSWYNDNAQSASDYVHGISKYLDEAGIPYKPAERTIPKIHQIKGKGNARPVEKYDPFTQDFVFSDNWDDVMDLENTGLKRLDDAFPNYEDAKFFSNANPNKKYVTQAEIDAHNLQVNQDLINEYAKHRLMPDPESKATFGRTEPMTIRELAELEFPGDIQKQANMIRGALQGQGGILPPLEGMKRGGKVSLSNNLDTMMLEVNNQKMKNGEPAYGAGKLVTTQAVKSTKVPPPIKFPVTRGPSIPEIRAMAERMAPQVMGEFVRAAPTPSNPKPSTSVVGKTQKQFEREKTLPIEYQNIKDPVTPEEFDYAKKKGALLIGGAGDVTPGNRMLLSIDDQPLSAPVHLQAGPEWEMYNPSAWAASDQMAKTYMNRAGKAAEAYDADPYLHYHKMTPDANFYAMHHLNSILGHLRPEELMLRDPKLYQQMVEEIRTRDVGYGKHPEFEGFEDPLNLQIHAQMDPNFRRHLSAIFNGPKFTERYGLNSGQDVLAATSLPELRDLEPGASGYAIVPLDVKAPLRNFEADSQTYDTGFPKAGPSGRSKYPSPYQLIYRDTLNWMKENPSENKSSEFGRMNMIVPKQQIDNELIEAIGEYQRRMKELTGKKKGGAVKKAEGGYLKKPAAYINGDEFVNAAKKYGIKDSMNNLNKIVDLVNKGLSVDDAARQVADSGMHKAAGGAISGDDLIIEERPL